MKRVAEFCSVIEHHPIWDNLFNNVKMVLSTFDAKERVTFYDISLALFINKDRRSMSRRVARKRCSWPRVVLLAAICCLIVPPLFGLVSSAAQSAAPAPGAPAPAGVVREVEAGLTQAVQRFEARDVAGVLAQVSEQYRTGPLTKAAIREQILTTYALYDSVKANVRIDEVRMVGEHAWVYSTGEVSGRLRLLGTPMVFLSWERELEVVRREGGAWRLFGYQQ